MLELAVDRLRAAANRFTPAYVLIALFLTMWNGAGARADAPQEPRVGFVWRAPADVECSTPRQMQARVARLSDIPLLIGAVETRYRIEVNVARQAESWRVDVNLFDSQTRASRERSVQGRTPSCGSIDVASAVVIATMLDGIRADNPAIRARAASADGGGLGLGAFAVASPALMPKAWLGAGIALETRGAFQVAFSGSAYLPAEERDARGRGARQWSLHAGLALCPRAARNNFLDLRLCAGAQAGAALASGVGLTVSQDSVVPLLFLEAGPKLTFEVTRSFALQLSASAAWTLVRPKISWNVEGEPTHSLTGSRIALLVRLGVTISPW